MALRFNRKKSVEARRSRASTDFFLTKNLSLSERFFVYSLGSLRLIKGLGTGGRSSENLGRGG
jgi:hypothetical protein